MSSPESPARLWSFAGALAVAAFVLNWLWEMLQMPAYAEMAGRPWTETARRCAFASLGDVAMTFAIVAMGSLAAGQIRWALTRKWNVYTAAALFGGGFAALFELFALASGRWSYTDSMPIVPVLRVGLWPLLQLTLLTPAALWLAAWWATRR